MFTLSGYRNRDISVTSVEVTYQNLFSAVHKNFCIPCSYETEKFSEESRLVAFLQERYLRAGKVARPVRNSSQTLRIEFALVLIQILDFDETNQVLTTNVWKRYVSND